MLRTALDAIYSSCRAFSVLRTARTLCDVWMRIWSYGGSTTNLSLWHLITRQNTTRFMQWRSEEEKDYHPGTACERDIIASGVNMIHHQYHIGISLGFLDRRGNQLYITANRRTSAWFVRGAFLFHLTTSFNAFRNHMQSQWHCGSNSNFRVENWCCSQRHFILCDKFTIK